MLRITTRYFAIDRADKARRVRADDAWAMLAFRPPGRTLDVVPLLPQREPGIVVLIGAVLLLEAWRPRFVERIGIRELSATPDPGPKPVTTDRPFVEPVARVLLSEHDRRDPVRLRNLTNFLLRNTADVLPVEVSSRLADNTGYRVDQRLLSEIVSGQHDGCLYDLQAHMVLLPRTAPIAQQAPLTVALNR
jgi:hypothetical protein